MIKRLLFTSALLVPGLAYGANPSADLSVQVVPAKAASTCGTIAGQAGTDVATAGFNTCALYSDFTTPIPNNVGTGLQGTPTPVAPTASGNWLDCNADGATNSVWYWGISLFTGASNNGCAGHVAQVTDGSNGLALRITSNYSEYANTAASEISGMQTINQTVTYYNPDQYPFGYFETTWRADDINDLDVEYWSPNSSAGVGPHYKIELDFLETFGNCNYGGTLEWPPSGSSNWNSWGGYQDNSCDYGHYHTFGVLWTSNGTSASSCVYVDGVRKGCPASRAFADPTSEALQRRHLFVEQIPNSNCSNPSNIWDISCGSPPNFGTSHMYVKSVRVLTCANWQQSGAAGMCKGTTLKSGGFYQ